jgi:hypothetical protein
MKAAERRLRTVARRLAVARQLEKDLIEERRELWRYLIDHGVGQAEVGRMAGVTPYAVFEALHREAP